MQSGKSGTLVIPAFERDSTQLRRIIFGARPRRTLCRVAAWGILCLCFFHHLLVPIQIIGSSMDPTYRDGSLNLVNRWSYARHPPDRGDVVALNAEGEILLKRIVALPGETVAIVEGRIQVNGRPLEDDFSFKRIPWELDPIPLAADEYFVIGDNRAASVFCKVLRSDILGKTLF